jgi:hypothetical protein
VLTSGVDFRKLVVHFRPKRKYLTGRWRWKWPQMKYFECRDHQRPHAAESKNPVMTAPVINNGAKSFLGPFSTFSRCYLQFYISLDGHY